MSDRRELLDALMFALVDRQLAYFGKSLGDVTLSRLSNEFARLGAMLWRAILDDEEVADSDILPASCPALFPPIIFAALEKKAADHPGSPDGEAPEVEGGNL
jgi:hypothetical protein